jgi:hypothetical protein
MAAFVVTASVAAVGFFVGCIVLAWRFLAGRVRLVGRICQDDGRLPIVSEAPAAELVQDDAYLPAVMRGER